MKIIQALGFYFPDSSGGTEVYVDGLVRQLHQLDQPSIRNYIAAPQKSNYETSYEYNGVSVYRYPLIGSFNLEQIRDIVPPNGFENFALWLKKQKADIYHQHSCITGCSIHHLREAKNQGMATVLTAHVPGNICLRGTMLLNGVEACDGHIEDVRCSNCWGMARGIPKGVASLIARIPQSISTYAAVEFSNQRLATVLATPALVAMHKNRFLEMVNLADRVVAVCQWLYDALVINGVSEKKLILCRQGITTTTPNSALKSQEFTNNTPLRIGFLGRWDRIKGIHILVQAVCDLPPNVSVELIIYALAQSEYAQTYQQEVQTLAANDPRIHFAKPLKRDAVAFALADLDMLAVPSQCLETGPLVVLEAQAVGTPVLGANIGGIAELVHHGVDGWLVPVNDISAWSQAIASFAQDRTKLTKLCQGIKPVRTMNEVALEMASLYQELL